MRSLSWSVGAFCVAVTLACGGGGLPEGLPEVAAPAAPALVKSAPGPAGTAWKRAPTAPGIGTVELPDGGGWVSSGSEARHEEKDITVMIQGQTGIDPEQRDEAVEMITAANTKDAPKYAVAATEKGEVMGNPGARIDGSFDNGTAYVTRDYVFISKGGMVALMARAPTAAKDEMHQIVDRMAASYRD
jgi:hypothetical protein